MKIISNQTFDEERALYGERDIIVRNCKFDGPEKIIKTIDTERRSV